MLCLHAPAPEGHRYSSRINIAETTTQQESATVHFIGVEQTTEDWRARTRDGVRVLRFSGNKPTAGLSRIRCSYCLPFSCLRAFLKICQTTRRERLFLSPRFDTKTLSFRTKPKAR